MVRTPTRTRSVLPSLAGHVAQNARRDRTPSTSHPSAGMPADAIEPVSKPDQLGMFGPEQGHRDGAANKSAQGRTAGIVAATTPPPRPVKFSTR